jgi:arylsulfatase A-like enzyme
VRPDTDSGGGTSRFDTRGPAFEAAEVPDNHFTDGKTAELAVGTLRQFAAEKKPFFLAVGFTKPHLPFVAPKRYWDLYDPAQIELAPNPYRPKNAPEFAILPGNEMRAYHGIPAGSIPPDLARQLKHGYLAATSYTDANIGKLLAELDRSGLRSNTIIVLWGDHGWKLGEHDAWCKHSNSENDTNAPLIISAPGVKAPGQRTRALVEFVDIYPTLCELAGLPRPAHLEGTSAAPLFQNPQQPWKTAAFSQYPRSVKREGTKNLQLMGYSMRTDRYRLTVWTHRHDPSVIEATELYDLTVDPMENENIAGDPARTELVQKLLTQWRAGWRSAQPPPS